MIERVITEASKIPNEYWVVLIDKTLDFVISKLPTGKNKLKELIRGHLKNYLSEYSSRYLTTKTLLRRDTPVPFLDVYYPLVLQCESSLTKVRMDTDGMRELLVTTKFLTIIGEAGSGKSTLTQYLFLECIRSNHKIPIRLELNRVNHDERYSLEAIINDEIFKNELALSSDILKKSLKKGDFIFFLDGFDEIIRDASNRVSTDLISFMNMYPENNYILTSRPFANAELLPKFSNYTLLPLNDKDVEKFIRQQLYDDIKLANDIISTLKESDINFIKSYLANPLLLTIFILTFRKYPSLPETMSVFYSRVVNTLLRGHDEKIKINFERKYKSGLSISNFEDILRKFSFLSYNEGYVNFKDQYLIDILDRDIKKQYPFDFDSRHVIDDLLLAAPFLTEDGDVLAFAHRSLQEYFAALCVFKMEEDDKRTFYSNMVNGNYNKSVLSENTNFLLLCRELDQMSFTKYYHLELLKKNSFSKDVLSGANQVKWFTETVFNTKSDDKVIFSHENILMWHPSNFTVFTIQFDVDIYSHILDVIRVISNAYKSIHDKAMSESSEFEQDQEVKEHTNYSHDQIAEKIILIDVLSQTEEIHISILQLIAFIDERIREIESELLSKQKNDGLRALI